MRAISTFGRNWKPLWVVFGSLAAALAQRKILWKTNIKSTRGLKLSPSLLMIYEINHIWTAEMKWKWRNDRRSERNLCNCVKKPEKKFRTSTGFEPVTSQYRWDALPTELWNHWRWEQVNCGFSYIINAHFFLGKIWTHNWPANNNDNNNNANNRGKLFPRSPFRNSWKGCYEVVWSRQLVLLNERRSYTYAWIAVVNGCLACTFS